jgi:hypothetical protein
MRALGRLLLGLLVALTACDRTRTMTHGCQQDSDCGDPASAWRCEVQTGTCYCRTNDACPNGQFCNNAGFCQDRAGCEKNVDCADPSLFCDTTTGTCLPVGRCDFDLQCPLGNVCDTSRNTCVEGCRSNGDCPGSSCRCGEVPCNCTGTTPADLQKCTIGVCDPYFCSDSSFCRFGELCGAQPDAGITRNQCFSDFDVDRRPYCTNCSFGGGVSVCGTGANYCLIDTQNPGNFFCGADCSEGQSCPRGYDCSDVIVVYTQWACTRANPACPANPTQTCAKNEDCKHGGTCVIPTGQALGSCAGKCSVSEGDPTGFCTCLVDSDCAQESCSAGECSISRKKCVTQNDCKPIRCVDFDGVGGCLIGQNCAPGNGLSCVQVGH